MWRSRAPAAHRHHGRGDETGGTALRACVREWDGREAAAASGTRRERLSRLDFDGRGAPSSSGRTLRPGGRAAGRFEAPLTFELKAAADGEPDAEKTSETTAASPDEAALEALRRRLAFRYPFEAQTKIPDKDGCFTACRQRVCRVLPVFGAPGVFAGRQADGRAAGKRAA